LIEINQKRLVNNPRTAHMKTPATGAGVHRK
jgi:hypothetical protein